MPLNKQTTIVTNAPPIDPRYTYSDIVRPEESLYIQNYFIHYWLRKVGPTLAWTIIALDQVKRRSGDSQCVTTQEFLANEIGVKRLTINRQLNANKWTKWFIPEIIREGSPLLPRHYKLASLPLTPEHQTGLYSYFKSLTTNNAATLLETIGELKNAPAKVVLEILEKRASKTDSDQFSVNPLSALQIIELATGLELNTLSEGVAGILIHQVEALEFHLKDLHETRCSQYFRREWTPTAGAALTWLVMVLRSKCFYGTDKRRKRRELRDTCIWTKKELAGMLGQSAKNLSRLREHPYAGHLFRIIKENKRSITIQVAIDFMEPLTTFTPEEVAAFWAKREPAVRSVFFPIGGGIEEDLKRILKPDKMIQRPDSIPDLLQKRIGQNDTTSQLSSKESDKMIQRADSTPKESDKMIQRADSTPKRIGQNDTTSQLSSKESDKMIQRTDSTPKESDKMIQRRGRIGQNDTTKGYESDKMIQRRGENPKRIGQNDTTKGENRTKRYNEGEESDKMIHIKYFKKVPYVVVINNKNNVKEILMKGGLSGIGLDELCAKNIDPLIARAVIFYAQANDLAAGYIYNHLINDHPTATHFLALASLDNATLASFDSVLQTIDASGGIFAASALSNIPTEQLDNFIAFVEAFGDDELVERVMAGIQGNGHNAQGMATSHLLNDGAAPLESDEDEPDEGEFLWQATLNQLKLQMTRSAYDTWLIETRLKSRDGATFTIVAPNEYTRDWLENRLKEVITRTLANIVFGDGNSPVLSAVERADVRVIFVTDEKIE